ncbi:MAG: hypothetical protein ABIQ05_02525 [Candidatus Limnocylindria bacterium]
MTDRPDPDDLVPVSVRLGTVVPPEDPEDWTRPLTWVAALGMLTAPMVTLAWFWLAPPTGRDAALAGTWLVALAVAGGAAAVGGTQIGRLRAFAGTLAAALFAGVVVVLIGAALAGERQVEAASPTVVHALAGAVAGLAGAAGASLVAPLLAGRPTRLTRAGIPALVGCAIAAAVTPLLFVS